MFRTNKQAKKYKAATKALIFELKIEQLLMGHLVPGLDSYFLRLFYSQQDKINMSIIFI